MGGVMLHTEVPTEYCVCRLLAEKNLPAAIEDTGGNELPESIREKAESVRSLGGLVSLQKKIYELPEHLQRNRDIQTEVGVLGVWEGWG